MYIIIHMAETVHCCGLGHIDAVYPAAAELPESQRKEPVKAGQKHAEYS